MTDPVSRFLEAIEKVESKAQRIAEQDEWDESPHDRLRLVINDRYPPALYDDVEYPRGPLLEVLNLADPSSVLRRCAADRKLIERDGPFCDCGEYGPPTNPYTGQPLLHHYDCSAYEAAKILSVAYGLSDHQEGEE